MGILTSALIATSKSIKRLNKTLEIYEPELLEMQETSANEIRTKDERLFMMIGTVIDQVKTLEEAMEKLTEAAEKLEEETDLRKFEVQADKVWDSILRGKQIISDLQLQRNRPISNERRDVQDTPEYETNDGIMLKSYEKMTPAIKIPRFSGSRWEFKNFWTIFDEIIGKSKLSDLLKFNHLVSYLDGEAKKLVSRFMLTTANYPKAVELLKLRYDNKPATVADLNRELRETKAKNDSVAEQRRLWDNLFVLMEQLKTLEQDVENDMFKDAILSKFSEKIQENVYEKLLNVGDQTKWTMSTIVLEIETTISKHEKLEEFLKNQRKSTTSKYDEWKESGKQIRDSRGSKNLKSNKKLSKKECMFCNEEDHWANQCKKVKDPKERSEILLKKKACLVCFRKGHNNIECPYEFYCKKCPTHRHNPAVCFQKNDSQIKSEINVKEANTMKANKQSKGTPKQTNIAKCEGETYEYEGQETE
uniref:CCHC-type domain-containing protein n=2 Tax=Caenorhabditis japonica TaxID=281687 RepID=A0A8R1DNV3_CAEJA